jgi:pSer/pThr/pTyr-binding forkhead associated (FHA) protein
MGNSEEYANADKPPFSLKIPQETAGGVPVLRLVLQPTGVFVDLKQPLAIAGRHSSADVRLPLPNISRRHCQFLFQNDAWHVMDLHSVNGVFVNGERITHTILHDHDTIGIGTFQFLVRINPGVAEAGELPSASAFADSDATASLTQIPQENLDRRKAS